LCCAQPGIILLTLDPVEADLGYSSTFTGLKKVLTAYLIFIVHVLEDKCPKFLVSLFLPYVTCQTEITRC
jgi:hypothetical protein